MTFFTFGASLGLTVGWGAKVSALVSKLGIGGKIGNIVAGAITQSGTGALVGGVMGAATGQGFMRGATAGALVGAATGGVAGAFKPVVGTGLGEGVLTQPGTSQAPIMSNSEALATLPSTPTGTLANVGAGAVDATATGGSSRFGSIWSSVVGSGGIGPIIQGVGQGLGAGLQAKERRESEDRRRSSYDIVMESIRPMKYTREGNTIMGRLAPE